MSLRIIPPLVQTTGLGLGVALLAALGPLPLFAAEISHSNFKIQLIAPDSWTSEKTGISVLPPAAELEIAKSRRLHFVPVNRPVNSLEEAMNLEMDSIDAQTAQAPASYGRQKLSGARRVRTASGIEGLCAEFAQTQNGRTHYEISKYYFQDPNGRIFKICAHIYGDAETAARYESILLQGLHFLQP